MKIWSEITCEFCLDIHLRDFLGFAWLACFLWFSLFYFFMITRFKLLLLLVPNVHKSMDLVYKFIKLIIPNYMLS
jgi:hypothetical protein